MPRLLVVVLTVVLGVGALVAPASARTVSGADPRGDVRVFLQGDESVGTPVDRPGVDLVGYRVRYAERRITVTLRLHDLRRRGPLRFFAGLLMEYPAGRGRTGYADLTVMATPRDRSGTSKINVMTGEDLDELAEGCPTRHRIDYRRHRVTISAPASCFGSPRFVDAFVGVYLTNRRESRFWSDTAPGEPEEGFDYPTTRIKRG